MVYPDVDFDDIDRAVDEFGFDPASPQLQFDDRQSTEACTRAL